MTPQEQVMEFKRATGGDERSYTEVIDLRKRLIKEELMEVNEAAQKALTALDTADLAYIAQELADLAYVTYGTALTLGIDLDAAIDAVHRANMSKMGPDGKPIVRPDGKILKGPNFRPPDMTAALVGKR